MPTTEWNAQQRAYQPSTTTALIPITQQPVIDPHARDLQRLASLARLEQAERDAAFEVALTRTNETLPFTNARKAAKRSEFQAYEGYVHAYHRTRWVENELFRAEVARIYGG